MSWLVSVTRWTRPSNSAPSEIESFWCIISPPTLAEVDAEGDFELS